jgi:glycosyltransferase involved in cell wall biosynthesis
MITVLVPTANRPAMLRTALGSIARQSAAARIGRVVVSENGNCRESEAVCAAFPSLPITYIFRQPTTALEHGRDLMREQLDGEFIAFLHDDDWWAPHHLATALAHFSANLDAAFCAAGHLTVRSESALTSSHDNAFAWFGSGYGTLDRPWVLSRLNVLMAQLLGTVAHYSSLVMRTAALRQSAFVYDLENPFDNDRLLIFALAAHGSLVFDPVPSLFVRHHGGMDCTNYARGLRDAHLCATTLWMVQASGRPWRVVADSFMRRLALCPEEARGRLNELAQKPWCLPELNRQLQERTQPALI